MWRASGRGCTVIPWAPASIAIRAHPVTLGIPSARELRSSAILLRFTLSRVMAGSPLYDIGIAPFCRDRLSVLDVAVERDRVAQLAQQIFFEGAQRPAGVGAREQVLQRRHVRIEKALVRVVPLQELHDELVEIEAASQREPFQRLVAALPLRAEQRIELAFSRPRH